MDREKLVVIVWVLLCTLIGSMAYIYGNVSNQNTIEERALTMNKECYDAIDLEFIIRGVKPH
jgi:hypothetical protein